MRLLKTIQLKWLLLISYFFTIVIAWSYGSSYVVYASASTVLMIITYSLFFLNSDCAFPIIRKTSIIITIFTCFLGFVNGNLQSSLMVNTSLLLPIAIASLQISYYNIQKQLMYASILSTPIIMYTGQHAEEWNSNSLAFMVFGGISIIFLWFKLSDTKLAKIISTSILVLMATYLFATGSRNAGMVMVLSVLLLLLPNTIYHSKFLFRILYLTPLLATIFAESIMTYIFSNDSIVEYLTSFTSQYSKKAWGMDTHLDVLVFVSNKFADLDIFTQLFGTGIKPGHCHNIFYQCLFFYGLIGTVTIYIMYITIFEYAYKLIRKYDDSLVLGCFIVLLGHFYLQVGEVYMLGSEATTIISILPTGIILQRLNYYKFYGNPNHHTLLQA